MLTVAQPRHHTDNDPLNKTDPLGLRPLDCDLGMEKLHAAAEDSRLDGDRDRAVKITGIGAQSIKDDSCILDFSGVGDGLIVEAFGDLRTADNIAVMIEGQNQNIFNQSARPKAQGIRAEANRLPGGGSTASIAWLGYNSPDNYIDSIGRSKATTGGENLVAFVSGLRAKFPGKRIVTVGHSYGSVVVGEAMSRGLAANDAVVTGSPGINANSVAQTGFGGHLYVGAAPFDPVGQDPIGSNIHGPPPYSIPGARRLDIGGATGHNGYYNEGSTSLRSIASVVTGQVRYRGNRWGF